MSKKIEVSGSAPVSSAAEEFSSRSEAPETSIHCDSVLKKDKNFSDVNSDFRCLLDVLMCEKVEKSVFTTNHSMAEDLSCKSVSCEQETSSNEVLNKDRSFSDVDSDWEEEDIQLLRLLKDNELKIWPKKLLSRYHQDDLYLAKVRQILNDVKDWKRIYDLLMEDFRNNSRTSKMKQDLASARGEVNSLKKAHRNALKSLAVREKSYQQVCNERDGLQQRVSDYEEKLQKMSEELQVAQQDRQTQQDQEKQRLQNQVTFLEGEKVKLEGFKVEAEKLRSQKHALTERNRTLQEECQHLSNQLRQVSEGDMAKLSMLDQLISAKKEQISILQNDLEQKNLEQIISTSSLYGGSASLLLSPEGNCIERRGILPMSKDSWSQHSGKLSIRAVSGELQKDVSDTAQ